MAQNAKNKTNEFFYKIAKRTKMEIFAFCVIPLEKIRIRPVKHLKMTI